MDGKDDGQNVAEKWASTSKPTPPQPTNKATVPPLGSVPKGHPLNCERTMVAGHILLVIGKWNKHYTAADAMRVLEFSEEDCKNKSLQRRVRRQRDRQLKNSPPLFIQTNSTSLISPLSNPPSTNNHTNSAANNSSSSNGDGGGNKNNNNNNNNTALAAVASAATALAATALPLTGLVPATATDSISAAGVLAKPKPRRNHSMVMYDKEQTQDARKRYCKSYETAGYMYKDQQLQQEDGRGVKRIAGQAICDAVNRMNNTNISVNTLKWRVNNGVEAPPRKGRPPILPPAVEEALATAMETLTLLTSAEMLEKPNRKEMVQRLQACLKDGPCCLKDYVSLFNRMQAKYAHTIEVSTQNTQLEERRAVWATRNNINDWFKNLKKLLIEKQFARLPTAEEKGNGHEGELVFLPGQLHRIVNVDETGLTLDGTGSKSGGRPVTEYGPANKSLPRGASRAPKSSSRCTLVAGSTASGDPIPFHFQLKSLAEEGKRRISTAFTNELDKAGCVTGTWGLGGEGGLKPHTAYCNPTAGMDGVEFQKYVETSIVSLYPDAQPANGKWVLLIVDSGPGRLNPKLLQLLSRKGFILLPGVPNTTHITQVTDQNFGPFKTAFRDNRKKLHASRCAERRTVKMFDIPSLVFGYRENWSLSLRSAFEEAFCPAASKACWRKIGISPFTRNCLGNRNVVHQLMMLSDGSIDLDADPATVQLLDLEFRNVNAIATLKEHGFAGEVFFKQAPRNYGKNSIATLPNTRARQDQIQEAKNTPGPKYAVLNGGAYNCTDQIIVHERIRREGIIKAMEGTKFKAAAYDKKREAAQPLIDKCDGDFMDLPVSELRKVFEWKLQEKSTRLNKDDMVGALMEAEKYPPVGEVKWIAEDEAEMKRLIEEDIKIKDTELGKAMAKDIKEMLSMTKSITPQRMEIAEAHLTQEELEHLRAVRMQWPCQG
eukprot:jgi/Psemu1/546/gm1.546_g